MILINDSINLINLINDSINGIDVNTVLCIGSQSVHTSRSSFRGRSMPMLRSGNLELMGLCRFHCSSEESCLSYLSVHADISNR